MRPPRIHRSRKGNNSRPTFYILCSKGICISLAMVLVDGMKLTHRRT